MLPACSMLFACLGLINVASCEPWFFRGRPWGKHGMLGSPASERSNHLELSKVQEYWCPQWLDHFDPTNNQTWKQRYFVSDQYFKPGGPVFLQLGGEGIADPVWLRKGQIASNYGPKFNALLIELEHRYYGQSHPTSDMSTENLRHLTSEQALADAASFIGYYKGKDARVQNSQWVVFGGSYSGSLAAWFRLKYPHLVAGAVASSAPMKAVINFKEYLRVVKDSLGPHCDAAINKATGQISQLLQHRVGWLKLQKTFNLCEPLDGQNQNDVQNLVSSLAGNFEGIVQYNKDNRDFEKSPTSNITIDTLCGVMTNGAFGLEIDRYAVVNNLLLNATKQTCLDFKYDSMIESLQELDWNSSAAEGGRQWTYQTCVEFGFFQSSDWPNQPFGPYFPIKFYEQQCKDIFGEKFSVELLKKAVDVTNNNYGGYDVRLTKVILPNGSIDPWHALGLVHYNYSDSKSLFIKGTAHCADMYPSSVNDSQELVNARNEIVSYLRHILHNTR